MNNEPIQADFEAMTFDALEYMQQASATNTLANVVCAESFAWEAMQQQWGVNAAYEVLQTDDE